MTPPATLLVLFYGIGEVKVALFLSSMRTIPNYSFWSFYILPFTVRGAIVIELVWLISGEKFQHLNPLRPRLLTRGPLDVTVFEMVRAPSATVLASVTSSLSVALLVLPAIYFITSLVWFANVL